MAKFNKNLGKIGFVAIAGAVAFYVLTEPDAATKRAKPRVTATGITAPEGFKPEDMTARFPRLAGPNRDIFTPKIIVKKTQPLTLTPPDGKAGALKKPTWVLTGVFVQNGVRLALLENQITGESQTIRAGENWMGQSVLAVKPEAVLFSNGTQMVFAEPPEETATAAAATPVLLPGAPTVSSGVTLPPIATPPAGTLPLPEASGGRNRSGGGGGRRQRNNQGDISQNRPISLNLPPDVASTQSSGSRP